MSDDRPKRSWRDIDRGKDKSSHRKQSHAKGGRRPGGAAAASRSHRSALDKLFDSGAVGELVRQRDEETGTEADLGPSRRKLGEAILTAESRADREQAVDVYLETFTLPPDFDILTHVLEHTDPDVVEDAMDRIEALLEEEKPRRARSLVANLKTLKELSEWGKLRRRAAALLDKF